MVYRWINYFKIINLSVNLLNYIQKYCSNNFSLFHLPAVAEVKLRDDQYTLDHMRAFGMYNYLHLDSWYQDNVYYIDQFGRVMNLSVTLVSRNLFLE